MKHTNSENFIMQMENAKIYYQISSDEEKLLKAPLKGSNSLRINDIELNYKNTTDMTFLNSLTSVSVDEDENTREFDENLPISGVHICTVFVTRLNLQ